MRKHARTWAGALGVTLLCVSMAACEGPGKGEERTESKTFTFSGDKLTVDAGNSDVRLRTDSTGGEVRVSRTVEGEAGKDGNSRWELTGSTLSLQTECHGISISCAARYTVTLPKDMAVSLTSSNGAVDSVGLTQSQEISSSNAAVKVENASGDVRLKVRDGNAEAIGISGGQLAAETRNGLAQGRLHRAAAQGDRQHRQRQRECHPPRGRRPLPGPGRRRERAGGVLGEGHPGRGTDRRRPQQQRERAGRPGGLTHSGLAEPELPIGRDRSVPVSLAVNI
ncbi:hypothetical protein SDIAM26S_03073 [Streptomyces diastaticus subsp. diastaticus]